MSPLFAIFPVTRQFLDLACDSNPPFVVLFVIFPVTRQLPDRYGKTYHHQVSSPPYGRFIAIDVLANRKYAPIDSALKSLYPHSP